LLIRAASALLTLLMIITASMPIPIAAAILHLPPSFADFAFAEDYASHDFASCHDFFFSSSHIFTPNITPLRFSRFCPPAADTPAPVALDALAAVSRRYGFHATFRRMLLMFYFISHFTPPLPDLSKTLRASLISLPPLAMPPAMITR